MNKNTKARAWDTDMKEMYKVSEIHFDTTPKKRPYIPDEYNNTYLIDDIGLMCSTNQNKSINEIHN